MSAELLREAAKVLRERAEAATPGPWERTEGACGPPSGDSVAYVRRVGTEDAYVAVGGRPSLDEDTRYIATMHPGVGLDLADWLERHARNLEGFMVESSDSPAARLARKILGRES